jgi:hypothetical protein
MSLFRALPRLGSDHTPILWKSGCVVAPKHVISRFVKWLLVRAGFKELAIKNIHCMLKLNDVVDIWQ